MIHIPILSFFSGGGFLDIGFEEAGFSVVWANENNQPFANMYEYGITSWRSSRGEVLSPAKVPNRSDVRSLSPAIVLEEAFQGNAPPFFGIIGGPPCTDFSVGGGGKGGLGEHGRLAGVFIELIERIRPGFFLVENVPGLWRIRRHQAFLLSSLSSLSSDYMIDISILNSLEYGVPQDRDRLFIVGFHKKLLADEILVSYRKGGWRFPWREPEYRDAKRLPWPRMAPFGSMVERPASVPLELTVYPSLVGPPKPNDLPNGNEVFNAYSQKFWQVPEGDDSGKSFKRLHRYRYSPTAWYGNNEVHLHPWEPRRLSVREAMRIQTIPDEYVIPKQYSLTAKFKLVCNGVPCVLARRVAESIRDFALIWSVGSDIGQ